MPNQMTKETLVALREHFVARQHELLALTCALVETESPSGDKDGSSAVVSLLASAAGSIGAVNSVERITSEDFGEHVRIRAFGGENEAAPIVILGHTDTVHPRGAVKTARKGTGMFTIKVHGRAAHAGLEPEKGVSAVLELARQTIRLHNLNDPATGTTVMVT